MKRLITLILLSFLTIGCNKKNGSKEEETGNLLAGAVPIVADTIQVRIEITGLDGGSLTLDAGLAGEVEITSSGTYTLPNSLEEGSEFSISEKGTSATAICTLSDETYLVTANLTIAISCESVSIPDSFKYLRSDFVFLSGHPELILEVPEQSYSAGSSYSISPQLPEGLTLNEINGAIEGQPSSSVTSATYTITQTRRDGSQKSTAIDLEVVDGFLVNSFEDADDDNKGDGSCSALGVTGPNNCTLRAAIGEANLLAGEQTIFFSGTHTLASKIAILEDVVIVGHDDSTSIIDGNGQDKIFEFDGTIKLTLKSMTLQNADANGSYGGAILMEGVDHSFYFSRVKFIGNTCGSGEDGCSFHSDDAIDFVIEYCEFRENVSTAYDAGAWIRNATNGVIRNTTVVDNVVTGEGSGISISNSNVNVYDSYFANNTASGVNGSLAYLSSSSGEVHRVTFEGNQALDSAGMIVNASSVNIFNSTFKGNIASDDGGGVVYQGPTATGIIKNSAFVDNQANEHAGGIWTIDGATTTVYNTYFSNNTNVLAGEIDHCNTHTAGSATTYHFYNFFAEADDNNCDPHVSSANNVIVGGELGLDTFDFHSSSVKTWNLLSTSPLIDAGDNTNCAATDARELARPIDGDGDTTATCDIGPYEYN